MFGKSSVENYFSSRYSIDLQAELSLHRAAHYDKTAMPEQQKLQGS